MTTYLRWWVEDETKQWSNDWFWSYWHVLAEEVDSIGDGDDDDDDDRGWPLLCGRWVNTKDMVTTDSDPVRAGWVLPRGSTAKPDNRRAPLCKTCARSLAARRPSGRRSPGRRA
jgi:hypothetical protein